MKRIINGRMYNTDTATKVATYSNSYFVNDFNFLSETLYRKRTGEYFIHGEGGAMTKYSHRCSDGSWCGGEIIVPISEAEARKWAEEHSDTADYIRVFGEPGE